MCGILGTLGFSVDEQLVRAVLADRGPDGFTHMSVAGLELFHGRLGIVHADHPDSKQPIQLDGLILVCNGFISNWLEMQAELGLEANRSDCAVLLKSYARRG